MNLRAIIVDDEPLAREGVELLLKDEPHVSVVASCADGSEAVRAILDNAIDVVFLDIHMPGLTGFDVIDAIGVSKMPAVVFLTAYDEHAVRAFRANAVDYLLKPIDADELSVSIERVRARLSASRAMQQAERLESLMTAVTSTPIAGLRAGLTAGRIAVRENQRVSFVDIERIVRVAANGDYVTICTSDKDILMRSSMSSIQERLSVHGFVRIHRSHLVNTRFISALEAIEGGGLRVVLNNGEAFPVSRTYKGALLSALGDDVPAV